MDEQASDQALLLFLAFMLPLYNKFNILFQAQKPNLHKLSGEMKLLLKVFMAHFITKSALASKVRPQDVDYRDFSNQKANEEFHWL